MTPDADALALALVADVVLGEPPAALHPVVWMGAVAAPLARAGLRLHGARAQRIAGVAIALAVPAGFAAAGTLAVAQVPGRALTILATALLLKPMFAGRALVAAGRAVEEALAAGDLDRARAGLRSLCSRDPARLDAPLIAAAAIESLAENASDSVVAPLCWYAVAGLPGAIAYRASNTLDAMIGYRGRYQHLGKAAARLDDLLNLIPARLTALLLLAAAPRRARGDGWRVLRRDGGATESPNAGRPMAAMAGLLGVALVKPGHYRLGDARAPLTAATIARARRIAAGAMGLAAALALAALEVRHALA